MISEAIALQKGVDAQCLMTEAPSAVDSEQLKELHIKLDKID
jgi:aspartyl-tRNA synthetase